MERFVRNIVLIGFMGSGKSTIAKILSDTLKMPMIDSDEYIAKQAKLSIREIFHKYGEAYFRNLERDFINTFSSHQNLIIATGGGMPIFNDISSLGIRFYLRSDFDTIVSRIKSDSSRPLFDDINQARKLYNDRMDKYAISSDHIIDSIDSAQSVAQSVLTIIERYYDA